MYVENDWHSRTEYMYNVASGKRADPIVRMWVDQCGNCGAVIRSRAESCEETRCPYCGCMNNRVDDGKGETCSR